MISRFPLEAAHAEPLPPSDPARRVLVAHFPLDGAVLALVCAHTVAVLGQARRAQISALLARRDDRMILGADLNDTPDALAGPIAAAGLRDALRDDSTPTWPMCPMTFRKAWESQLLRAPNFSLEPRRLDYLLSRGVLGLSAQVDQLHDGDGYASDHALVWVASAPRRDLPSVRPAGRSCGQSLNPSSGDRGEIATVKPARRAADVRDGET